MVFAHCDNFSLNDSLEIANNDPPVTKFKQKDFEFSFFFILFFNMDDLVFDVRIKALITYEFPFKICNGVHNLIIAYDGYQQLISKLSCLVMNSLQVTPDFPIDPETNFSCFQKIMFSAPIIKNFDHCSFHHFIRVIIYCFTRTYIQQVSKFFSLFIV